MKDMITLMLITLICFPAISSDQDQSSYQSLDLEAMRNLSREQVDALPVETRRAYFKQMSHKRFGGQVEKPGSRQGRCLVVDSSGTANQDMFVRDFAILEKTIKVSPRLISGNSVTPTSATQARVNYNANAAVFLLKSNDLPAFLIAPEEGWGIINVSKLQYEGITSEVLSKRITVETTRAISLICGCGNVGLSMSAIVSPSDIDALQYTGFPASASKNCSTQLKKLGFSAPKVCDYRQACKEGWAPLPQDEFQQAIWNEVYKIPAEPIKIQYQQK